MIIRAVYVYYYNMFSVVFQTFLSSFLCLQNYQDYSTYKVYFQIFIIISSQLSPFFIQSSLFVDIPIIRPKVSTERPIFVEKWRISLIVSTRKATLVETHTLPKFKNQVKIWKCLGGGYICVIKPFTHEKDIYFPVVAAGCHVVL